eukprot:768681-Hanusia_phi.AAC.13
MEEQGILYSGTGNIVWRNREYCMEEQGILYGGTGNIVTIGGPVAMSNWAAGMIFSDYAPAPSKPVTSSESSKQISNGANNDMARQRQVVGLQAFIHAPCFSWMTPSRLRPPLGTRT